MSKIYDLFYDLKHNSINYLNASTGELFEERLKTRLARLGYNRVLPTDLSQSTFSELKNRIVQRDEIIHNQMEFNYHYLHQPFGSQSYPDFIIMDTQILVCIESKFSKGKQEKPVWNSGLPRANGLYIFGSYGKQDITFFRGCDVLSNQERQLLQKFFAEEMERAASFNEQHMSKQEFGFAAYARKAYEQKRVYNPDAIIKFFNNDKRLILENSVLTYLKTI